MRRPGLHAGRQDLDAAPGEARQGRPRGEPGDDRLVGRVPASAAGKRVVYDAEHFFDGYRAEPRLRAALHRAPRRRPAPRRSRCCDTNGSSLPSQVAAATADAVAALGERRARRHPLPQRRRMRRRQHARRGRGRRAPGAGHDERMRRAHRQRQPRLDHRQPAAQARLPLPDRRAARAPDRDGPLRRRAAERHARPEPALRRAQRVRAQGRHARCRRQRRREHLRAHRPRARRQPARAARVGAGGPREREREGRGARDRAGRDDDAQGARADQGPRASRLPVRGRRRLARTAAAPRDGRLRAAVSRSSPGA